VLIFTPIAIALEYLVPERHLLVFIVAAIALLPSAGWMGNASNAIAYWRSNIDRDARGADKNFVDEAVEQAETPATRTR